MALRHERELWPAGAGLPAPGAGRADSPALGGHAPCHRVVADREGAGVRPAADDDGQRRPHDRPGDAFAHFGRIFKTLHLLQFLDSEAYRRMIGVQLNIGEGRHSLGRRIFFGRLGELRHGYRDGMEDQLGALGPALNAVVWWNTLYTDAAVKKLEAGGVTISPEIRSRLSPLVKTGLTRTDGGSGIG
ncbi:Tn3 family transposase [Streptomyces sp. NPDC058989]|uniref:Tn3 family transposase n=1 Tax=Streptomyces sp. NPDC058989 TaxID=3346686 RepID=UPI0036839987